MIYLLRADHWLIVALSQVCTALALTGHSRSSRTHRRQGYKRRARGSGGARALPPPAGAFCAQKLTDKSGAVAPTVRADRYTAASNSSIAHIALLLLYHCTISRLILFLDSQSRLRLVGGGLSSGSVVHILLLRSIL